MSTFLYHVYEFHAYFNRHANATLPMTVERMGNYKLL